MDIRLEHGIIGEYQGLDVYVIDKGEFEEDFDETYCEDDEVIYVVVDKKSKKAESLMVLEGEVIGHLSPTGGVTEYNNPFAYLVGKKKSPAAQVLDSFREEKKRAAAAVEVEVEEVRGEIDIDKFIRDALSVDLLEGWNLTLTC